jgi:hypothetical protein
MARRDFTHGGDYFAILKGAFLALRFDITTGAAAGGRFSICIWIAKRSLPIWAVIVGVPAFSGAFVNGNTLFVRFFIGPLMPLVLGQKQVFARAPNPASSTQAASV